MFHGIRNTLNILWLNFEHGIHIKMKYLQILLFLICKKQFAENNAQICQLIQNNGELTPETLSRIILKRSGLFCS